MSELDVGSYLERAARLFPDHGAVLFEGARLTYRELHEQAAQVAAGLLELGLDRGDHVADLRVNGLDSVVLDWALSLAGLVKVPLNPKHSPTEIGQLVANANARALITEPEQSDAIEVVRSQCAEVQLIVSDGVDGAVPLSNLIGDPLADRIRNSGDDLLALRYTGGTTGLPKAATQTHRAAIATSVNILLDYLPLREDDVVFPTQPYPHGGCIYTIPAAMRGCAQVFRRSFDVDDVLTTIERDHVTVLKIVPTTLFRLLHAQRENPRDLTSLRLVAYGAAPMPEVLLREAMDLFDCSFTQTYGCAAAPATISTLDEATHEQERRTPGKRLRSVGRPYSLTDVRIVGDDGNDVPPGAVGEVVVGGAFVTQGFWNDPEETARTVRDDRIHTGDLGYLDGGYLYLAGRMNDLINSGGYNVYPAEVEQALTAVDGVAEAAVTSVPDPEWGERVVTAVVLEPDAATGAEQIVRELRNRLAGYKVPKYLHVVDRLPQTPNAKVDRQATRALILEALDPASGDVR